MTIQTREDGTQFIDATPTWAGLMPGLVAALQNGGPLGQTIAREELLRLAGAVDAMNAANKAARDNAPDVESAELCLAAYPEAELNAATGKEKIRDMARDFRAELAGLVAQFETNKAKES